MSAPGRPRLSSSTGKLPSSIFSSLQDRIAAYRGELFPLHIGDTYLAPPIDPATLDLGDAALYRYGKIAGSEELVSAIVEHVAPRPGFACVSGRNVQLSAGATHGICSAARAVLEPGDEVLLPTPYWPLAAGMIIAAGAHPVEVPLSPRLYADPDTDPRDVLEPLVTPRTRAIYLITPNNPDGKVYTRAQLEGIADVALRHHLWVISDEVYQDYVYEGEHVAMASLPGMAERTLTALSFSKSHGLAGLRIGYLIGPEEAITAVRALHFHTIYSVPLLVQRMALGALRGGGAWLDRAREDYRRTRDDVAALLVEAGLPHDRPEGGSYFFVHFGALLGERPLVALLERAVDRGVLLAPGVAFGQAHARSARICFTGAPRDRVLEGVARLCALVRDLA